MANATAPSTTISKSARIIGAALVGAVALALAAASPAAAGQAPFTAYGTGLQPGDVVKAYVGGEICSKTTADSAGQWLLKVSDTDPCQPTEGAKITFTLNGASTDAYEVWAAGGAPKDVANGVVLAASGEPTKPTTGTSQSTYFSGEVPEKGFGLLVCKGAYLEDALGALGEAKSLWIAKDGQLKGYVVGSPEFVNQAFTALLEGGYIPENTPLIIVVQ